MDDVETVTTIIIYRMKTMKIVIMFKVTYYRVILWYGLIEIQERSEKCSDLRGGGNIESDSKNMSECFRVYLKTFF